MRRGSRAWRAQALGEGIDGLLKSWGRNDVASCFLLRCGHCHRVQYCHVTSPLSPAAPNKPQAK